MDSELRLRSEGRLYSLMDHDSQTGVQGRAAEDSKSIKRLIFHSLHEHAINLKKKKKA